MKYTRAPVSPWFQCQLFVASVIILCIGVQGPLHRFTCRDRAPELILYGPITYTQPTESVSVSVHIQNFIETDIPKNEFTFAGTILFAFNEQKISLADIGKFTIDGGELLEKLEPSVTKRGPMTIARYVIRAKFKTDLNFTAYPLDDHLINLVISNPFIDATQVAFTTTPSDFSYSADVHIPNAHIIHTQVTAGYTQYQEHAHPRVVFSIACDRIDVRHFVNLVLPLLLIFFMTLFAFSVDHIQQYSSALSLAAAGAPGLLAYRFVIETASPDVDYFMLSDYLFFLFLALSFAIFFATLVALEYSQKTKKILIMSFYAIMVSTCLGLFYLIL